MLFVRRNSCVAPSGFTCNVQQNPVVEQASSGVTFCGAYGHFTSRKPNGSSAFDASKTAPSVVAPKYGCSVLMWNPQGATDVWVAMNPLVPDVLMDSEGFMVNVAADSNCFGCRMLRTKLSGGVLSFLLRTFPNIEAVSLNHHTLCHTVDFLCCLVSLLIFRMDSSESETSLKCIYCNLQGCCTWRCGI